MPNETELNNVTQVGSSRVRYVEPNYTNSILQQGPRGLHSYEFENPLEDYCLFINLKVEVRGRAIRTDYTSNSKVYTMNYYSQQGKEAVSFLQGTNYPNAKQNVYGKNNPSLTTDYLNHLYINDLVKRNVNDVVTGTNVTTELFGINSIDVQYNNWLAPEITIKFTDVRGASLFAAEEARHHITDNQSIQGISDANVEGSFFKCFFTFPYPKFTLAMKGFYGQPVAYELNCSDFRASFNSETGNFEATVKFIGFSYSFLSDVMMNALTAAPFSDYLGKKYWDENIANGRFTVKDVNNQDVPMMTLGAIVTKVDSAMNEASGMVASSSAAQESLKLDAKNDEILSVDKAYKNYTGAIYRSVVSASESYKESNKGFSYTIQDGANLLAFIPGADGNDTFEDAAISWWAAFTNSSEVAEAYDALQKTIENNDKYKSKVEKLNYKKIKPIRIYNADGHYVNKDFLNAKPAFKNGITKNEEISKKNAEDGVAIIQKQKLYYAYAFFDNDLSGDIAKDKQENDTAIQQNQEELSEVSAQAIGECLGFNPTIESITRIIMAHFETLMYMLTTCSREITGQSRTLESLGITTENTKDITNDDKVVPPFPKVTEHITVEGVEKDEESWIGNFQGDWLEKDLVNGLLNGVNEMAKLIKDAENGNGGETGSLSAIMKIPLNPLDMVLDKNPYGDINFSDKSSFAGHVVLRMFEILALNKEYASVESMEKLGEAEAINFMDLFKNIPQEFITWLKSTNIVNLIVNIAEAKDSTPVDKYGKNNKYAWESRSTSTNFHMPLMLKGVLTEFNGDGKTFLPVQNCNFAKIQNEIGPANAKHQYLYPRNYNDYIVSNTASSLKSPTGTVNQTCGKLLYIEPNPNRFSTIAENQCKNTGVSGDMDNLYKKFVGETKFSAEAFGKYIQDGKDYIIKNTTDDSNQSGKLTVTDVEDWAKKFGGGFDEFAKDDTNKVDNYRVLLVPAVKTDDSDIKDIDDNVDGVIEAKGCLFMQNYYYGRNIEEKAILYLISLGYYVDYDSVFDDMFDDDNSFVNVPKAAVLFAGALCDLYNPKYSTFTKTFVKFKDDDRIKNLRQDVRNELSSYFRKWVSSEYSKIDSYLSLKTDNYAAFFAQLKKICGVVYTSDSDIEALVSKYMANMSANYSVIDDEAKHIFFDHTSTASIRLGMKPSSYGALMTTRLVLGAVTFVKTADVFSNPKENFMIDNGKGNAFLTAFIKKITDTYVDDTSGTTNASDIQRAEDCQTDIDIKIALYRYLKLLYDKWIAGSIFEQQFTMEKFFEGDDRFFYFIDSYYNKIGNLVLVNIGKFKDDIMDCEVQDGYTLLSFLSQTYSQNRCSLFCIQNFLDLGDSNNLSRMFKPISLMDMDIPDVTPNFIVQYPYETSSHLDLGDKNSSDYPDDSFSIKNSPQLLGNGNDVNKWPSPLNSGSDAGYTIPAFGVSYGKMYQSYFKNISISMDNPMVTEQSIKAQFQIASMNNENEKNVNDGGTATRGMITMGQDLFTIYSNNSYTCEIDMMGNAWVQPLMYFELLNVPMFRGTYLVEKVSHHIEAGEMTTHIVGVRMANTTTKIKKGWFWAANPCGTGGGDGENLENQLADVTNDCAYASYPLGGVGGGIMGLHVSVNGVSALNMNEAGGEYWLSHGATSKILEGESVPTIGPGLTRYAWKGLGNNEYHSTQEIKQHFIATLKDEDKKVAQLIKGKNFSQNAIDSLYHAIHWGPGNVFPLFKSCNTSQDVSNKWLNIPFEKFKNAGRYGKGWAKMCSVWHTISSGQKQNTTTSVRGYPVADKRGAQAIVDAYYNPSSTIRQHFSAPPATNDTTKKDGKDKGIWDDFIYSVNQTSQSTPSCGLNVGAEKKGPNSGWITTGNNGTGGADKLATVFDIILSTYSEYIQELWWVAANAHDTNGPIRLEVIVSQKPVYANLKVGMKINGTNTAFKGVNANTNEKYRRAIVKFYSQNNRHKAGNENEGAYGKVVQSKIPKEDWDKLKPTACSELMSNSTGGGVSAPNGTWQNAVQKIGAWYSQNVHEFNEGRSSHCPLINESVGHWCSGLVSACLKYFNPSIPISSSGQIAGGCNGKLEAAGFKRLPYNPNDLQPYDIYATNGHTGIWVGDKKAYDWGNWKPDKGTVMTEPRSVGFPPCAMKFSTIWRKT